MTPQRPDLKLEPGPPIERAARVLPSPVDSVPSRKAAEIIADHFRADIGTGKLRDGDSLPSERELVGHFGVSRPTLRAAFRILESESLITIARGARGGPRVRHPNAEATARNVGLLLHLRGTRIADFFHVRSLIEPAAARLLAESRPPAGLEQLRRLIVAEEASLDDAEAFRSSAISFYRAVTDHCGSDILAI